MSQVQRVEGPNETPINAENVSGGTSVNVDGIPVYNQHSLAPRALSSLLAPGGANGQA